MAVQVSGANAVDINSTSVERALDLLAEALAILDQSNVAPEVGARLAEVISAAEEQHNSAERCRESAVT